MGCWQCCSSLLLCFFSLILGFLVVMSWSIPGDMNPTYYPVSVSLGSLIHVASVYTLISIINMIFGYFFLVQQEIFH